MQLDKDSQLKCFKLSRITLSYYYTDKIGGIIPSKPKVDIGTTVTLTCFNKGVTMWFFVGQSTNSRGIRILPEQSNRLVLVNVMLGNRGTYKCFGTFLGQTHLSETTLQVYGNNCGLCVQLHDRNIITIL